MLCSRLLSFVTQVKQSKVKKIWHSIAKEESRRRMSSESAVLAAEPAPASNGPPSDKEDKKRCRAEIFGLPAIKKRPKFFQSHPLILIFICLL